MLLLNVVVTIYIYIIVEPLDLHPSAYRPFPLRKVTLFELRKVKMVLSIKTNTPQNGSFVVVDLATALGPSDL